MLLADSTMEHMFRSFFSRDGFRHSLGLSASLEIDPGVDVLHKPGKTDQGLYHESAQILSELGASENYHRVLVVLDSEFGTHYTPEQVRRKISGDLTKVGWTEDRFRVLVIEPELEAWIWQDSPHVEAAFKYDRTSNGGRSLKSFLQGQMNGTSPWWPPDSAKPPRPKEAVDFVRGKFRSGNRTAVCKSVCSRISTRGCVDRTFQEMVVTLQGWFPPVGAAMEGGQA